MGVDEETKLDSIEQIKQMLEAKKNERKKEVINLFAYLRKHFVLLLHNKIIQVQSCLVEALNVTQPKIVVLLGTINVSLCLKFYQDQINLGKRTSERRSGHRPPWIQQVSRHTLTSLDSACFIWI